ncbi:MBL fold metallo-hydrolase [Cohnella sp. CFH 77786]|uniref:MBL fold metallo-hydrolase n=1 Tax=Cohnella sp. CFH 77786 TaxID=2662265 RepID=UPI001C60899E|nr:MBL fold metallo-hydrolase [Cohnella sp. CFH 77786]MBW5445392.1 MBL fold metallo-hydrolase [Cohnella sp. CFH 77786]
MELIPLKLEMDAGGNPFIVHAALFRDESNLILVDTGIAGQLEIIRRAVESAGIPFGRLTKIIITHQDRDHIGSLPELVEAFGGKVEVLAHEEAVPYLKGEVPLIKSGMIAPAVDVGVKLKDGDVLSHAGGIRVIHTPGHTPDHISLYHPSSKTLVSGDALTAQDGVLMPPTPQFTPDWESAMQSVSKLLVYDIETVITYHGGVCKERIRERLTEIAASAKADK